MLSMMAVIQEVFRGIAPLGMALLKHCARAMRGRDLPGLDSADPLFPDFAESAVADQILDHSRALRGARHFA